MSNYTQNDLTGDLAPVNVETKKIEDAVDSQLDRNPSEGQSNAMNTELDMNSYRIINLEKPQNENDAARLKDVQAAADKGYPDQTGESGKYLTTDGSVVSWAFPILPNGVNELTSDEVSQLKNINSVTLSNTQWGYLGGMDQGVSTSDSVDFANISLNGAPLGTASTKDVTTSAIDTTAGRVATFFSGDGIVGLGGSNLTDKSTDPANETRIGFDFYSSAPGTPTPDVGAYHIMTFGANGGSVGAENTVKLAARQGANDYYVQNGVAGGWQELYHTANLNVNEFAGGVSGAFSIHGFGFDSTVVYFYLPINSFTAPASITVGNTFQLADSSNSVVVSGVTPAFEGTRSDNRVCVISVSGLSGITVGKHYILKPEVGSSKITVNF